MVPMSYGTLGDLANDRFLASSSIILPITYVAPAIVACFNCQLMARLELMALR